MTQAIARPAHRVPGWASWLGFVILCNAVGFTSSLLGGEPTVYRELVRPSWAPPPVVFAPVWTALYTMMGTATWLVWTRSNDRSAAMQVFAAQLATNFLWTPVFFGLQQYGLAVLVIAANWVAVLAMIVVYSRRVRAAGWLVVPLLAWVSFATALNVAIWLLNR
jgi:translocator protein